MKYKPNDIVDLGYMLVRIISESRYKHYDYYVELLFLESGINSSPWHGNHADIQEILIKGPNSKPKG